MDKKIKVPPLISPGLMSQCAFKLLESHTGAAKMLNGGIHKLIGI